MPHDLKSPVGDHLVGVHVHGCSRASLHHVHRELVVELSVDDLAACLHDRVGDLRIHSSEFLVRLCRGKLDAGHGDDVLRVVAHPGVGNLIIIESPLCLNTVVGLSRNLKFPKKIGFNPEFLFAHNKSILLVYKLFYNLSDKGKSKKDYKQKCRDIFQIIIYLPGLSRSDWGCMAIVRIESAGPIGSALLHIHLSKILFL